MRCVVGVVALTFPLMGTGCSTDYCKNVDGPGDIVQVWWKPGDVPKAARYRICAGASCAVVVPFAIGPKYVGSGPFRAVEASVGATHVKARFELLSASGGVLTSFSGEGNETGRCFKTTVFHAEPPGQLVLEQIPEGA